jgi:hypothetical protein
MYFIIESYDVNIMPPFWYTLYMYYVVVNSIIEEKRKRTTPGIYLIPCTAKKNKIKFICHLEIVTENVPFWECQNDNFGKLEKVPGSQNLTYGS